MIRLSAEHQTDKEATRSNRSPRPEVFTPLRCLAKRRNAVEGKPSTHIPVSATTGQTQLTLMPSLANSAASPFVAAVTAPLEPAYHTRLGRGRFAEIEEMLTKTPCPVKGQNENPSALQRVSEKWTYCAASKTSSSQWLRESRGGARRPEASRMLPLSLRHGAFP